MELGLAEEGWQLIHQDALVADRHVEPGGAEAAQHHEGGMTEGEHAGIADEDVEPDHHDELDQGIGRDTLQYDWAERAERRQDDEDHGEREQRPDAAHRVFEAGQPGPHHTRSRVSAPRKSPCGRASSTMITEAKTKASL